MLFSMLVCRLEQVAQRDCRGSLFQFVDALLFKLGPLCIASSPCLSLLFSTIFVCVRCHTSFVDS